MENSSLHSAIDRFTCEMENWEKRLEYYKHENIYFKSRLCELLEGISDMSSLKKTEEFYEDFLAQDFIYAFLAGEVSKYRNFLKSESESDTEFSDMLSENLKKLKRDFMKAETLFAERKNKFLEFINNQTDFLLT